MMFEEMLLEELKGKLVECKLNYKIQEKQADIYHKRRISLEICTIILAALTTSGLFVIILGEESHSLKIATAIISAVNMILTVLPLKFNYEGLQKEHKTCAFQWFRLREEYNDFYMELHSVMLSKCHKVNYLKSKRSELLIEYEKISEMTPIASNKAHKRAKEELNYESEIIIL